MPLELTFEKPSTFILHASGEVTRAETLRVLADLTAHPDLQPGVGLLTDARQVTGAPSATELREIAFAMKPALARGLCASAILTDSPFVYGVARMFVVFAELINLDACPFRDEDEARRWLVERAAAARTAEKAPR